MKGSGVQRLELFALLLIKSCGLYIVIVQEGTCSNVNIATEAKR